MEVAARPGWMDDEFLANCVINSNHLPKESNVDINYAIVYYAVPKGENYMSLIYRVNVDYHVTGHAKSNGVQNGGGNKESFIVKASHESENLKHMAKEFKIFAKEIDMYQNIVPELSKTLVNAGIDGNIICRCLYIVEGERDVLVMEDLNQKGYILGDRLAGLDLVHSKLVLDKQARMHAASMHYFKTHAIPEMYLDPPFGSQKNDAFKDTMKILHESLHKKIANILAELDKNPKCGQHVIDFFKKYDEVLSEVVNKDYNPIPGNKFNAIIHGDCWVNNMMFKYNDDGSINDVVFIDLQISYHSSVAMDFIYFFFTSTNKEVKGHHFKNLQKYYLDALSHYLKKMGFTGEIPTMEEFEVELKRIVLFAVFILSHANSVILAEHKAEDKDRSKAEVFEIADMLQMKGGSKTYNDVLFMGIDILDEHGFFDNLNVLEVAPKSLD